MRDVKVEIVAGLSLIALGLSLQALAHDKPPARPHAHIDVLKANGASSAEPE
ncbi:MAG: hypothetical protein ACOH12_05790 [Parvibaculaceae bacterium]